MRCSVDEAERREEIIRELLAGGALQLKALVQAVRGRTGHASTGILHRLIRTGELVRMAEPGSNVVMIRLRRRYRTKGRGASCPA